MQDTCIVSMIDGGEILCPANSDGDDCVFSRIINEDNTESYKACIPDIYIDPIYIENDSCYENNESGSSVQSSIFKL